jgi:dimethylglycine dehydrogenase
VTEKVGIQDMSAFVPDFRPGAEEWLGKLCPTRCPRRSAVSLSYLLTPAGGVRRVHRLQARAELLSGFAGALEAHDHDYLLKALPPTVRCASSG